MFGLFRKRPATLAEELEKLHMDVAATLVEAGKLDELSRMGKVAGAFGSMASVLRQHYPDYPIEEDSPAMLILRGGDGPAELTEAEKWARHAIEAAQLHWPNKAALVVLLTFCFAPSHAEKLRAEALKGHAKSH